MASIYTPHFIQFLDDDGNILSGGKLYTYDAGTTTPKATYTAADGLTPNANPVVLDSSGRATVFLSGSYKFRLEDSLGNLIEETDNITAFSTAESGVDDIVTNFTEAVIATDDNIIFADTSDGNATRRDTVQGILDLTFQSGDPTIFSSSYTALSGTGPTISGIPSGVKRVTISFAGVSFSSTDNFMIQLGDAGGIETSGYTGSYSTIVSNTAGQATISSGFVFVLGAAASTLHGKLVLDLMDSATNTWMATGAAGSTGTIRMSFVGGSKALSEEITQVKFLGDAGGTIDAGNATVSWEF